MSEKSSCDRSKPALSEAQVSDAYLVSAKEWAEFLIKRETRGPGDYDNAMRRVHKVPYSLLWSLIYRPPKDIGVRKFLQLRNAYLAACEAEKKRLEDAIKKTRETTGLTPDDCLALRAGVALVDAADET